MKIKYRQAIKQTFPAICRATHATKPNIWSEMSEEGGNVVIPITEKQHKILKVIPLEGINYGEIQRLTGLAAPQLSGNLTELVKKGVVIKEGERRRYIFKSSGEPVTVTEKVREVVVPREKEHDPALDQAAAIELDDDQLLYLKSQRHEKRSVLARKLGISRLELNFALEKLGRR